MSPKTDKKSQGQLIRTCIYDIFFVVVLGYKQFPHGSFAINNNFDKLNNNEIVLQVCLSDSVINFGLCWRIFYPFKRFLSMFGIWCNNLTVPLIT